MTFCLKIALLFIFVLNCVIVFPTHRSKIDDKFPIVLIPGDGGSQATAIIKEDRSKVLNLWINLKYFISLSYFTKYFKLNYDKQTRNVTDSDLADIVFPGWGDTWSIENLDQTKHYKTVYYQYLVEAIVLDKFYIRNRTIRGAPFDFRKSPNESPEFYYKLKSLIEETYELSEDRPVVLLGHSLGALYSLGFLHKMSYDWKKKYIKTFVCASGPLGGSVKALKIQSSGDNLGFIVRSPLIFREVQRSMPSLAFLLPDKRIFPPNETLIITPDRNYSAHTLDKFFHDINFPEGYQMMLDSKRSVDGFVGPTGVDDIYCVHGSQMATTYQMVYYPPTFWRSAFPDQTPELIMGEGDGTVHQRSLQLCRFWKGAKYFVIPGAEHVKILGHETFINLIQNISGASVHKY